VGSSGEIELDDMDSLDANYKLWWTKEERERADNTNWMATNSFVRMDANYKLMKIKNYVNEN
jgi:hypothetical protein